MWTVGCPPRDCDDHDASRSPGELEDLDQPEDENCNGSVGMMRPFVNTNFPASTWARSPTVLVNGDSFLILAATGGWTSRSMSVTFATEQIVALDIGTLTGTGCEMSISLTSGGVGTTYIEALTAAGTSVRPFPGTGLTRRLDQLRFACAAGSSLSVDWIQVQDAVDIFPPPEELSFEWSDTRAPGGGLTTSIVREGGDGWVYMGSDVGGFARNDPAAPTWEVANGDGFSSLLQTGANGVWDILPIDAPEYESGALLFALVGDGDNSHVAGGLYTTTDRGDVWSQEATSWDNDGSNSKAVDPTGDDIAGQGRLTQCDEAKGYGGGRLLQADVRSPAIDSTVYIANADEDARGVSIFDGTTSCALPNVGTPLPAEAIGAILRIDVEPSGTAVLVVGYRGRPANAPGVYVCELPDPTTSPLTCGGTAYADCWPAANTEGVDVRDLELDTYLDLTFETGILVADGGNRPATSSSSCTAADTAVHELHLDDTSGAVVDLFDTLVDGADFPAGAYAGTNPVTGISVDPGAGFLFVNIPVTSGSVYTYDRLMRIDMADLHAGLMTWGVVNSGVTPAVYTVEDADEALRRADSDYQGAWLEATINGRAAPFPARSSPGNGIDTIWLSSWPEGNGLWGVIPTTNEAWLVSGLAAAWGDTDGDGIADAENDTTWTFWPDIHGDGRSFQTSVVLDVAIDNGGMAWAAAMDLGLEQTDLTEIYGYGAEIDCLWNGWIAGGNSVAVAPLDGSVWFTLLEQGSTSSSYPNNIGVARTTDQGASWSYAGGAMTDLSVELSNAAYLYDRVCIDGDETKRSAQPFDTTNRLTSAHGFLVDPTVAAASDAATESFGATHQVEAIDQDTALVWFQPTSPGTSFATDGGLYLTVDGGVSWAPVPFDGDWFGDGATSDDCTAYTTFKNGIFDILHPGAESMWFFDGTGAWDTALSSIQIVVGVPEASGDDDGGNEECAMAVVDIHPHPTTASTLQATWHWVPLPEDNSSGCTLDRSNLRGVAVPRWADEVALWGGYTREFASGSMTTRHGGVCLLDLNTEAFSLLVNPAVDEYDIGGVAPSPDIADLYAVLPGRSTGGWQECQDLGTGSTPGVPCEDAPWPRIYWRAGTGWSYREMTTAPPTPRINAASWSPIGAGVNNLDGTWLGVGTGGSGMWVGKATW